MTLIEEKTLADHDINVRSTRQELLLLEEQLKKHGRNEPQPSPSVTADPDTVSMQPETTTEIQKILDYLDNELHPLVSPDNWNVYSELYDMVSELENLPPSPTPSRQAEPQTNCDYCHEDSDGYVTPIEKNNHAFVRFGMDGWELSLKANGWHGEARIKFCPMCGRRLADD